MMIIKYNDYHLAMAPATRPMLSVRLDEHLYSRRILIKIDLH